MSDIRLGLTFDDVLLIPNRSSITSRRDVDYSSFLTKNIRLSLPILSANMDTVTESSMAIAMASEGGMGIIHRFMPIEKEVKEVLKVKRHESFVVEDPFTIPLDGYTVSDARKFMEEYQITGLLIVDGSKKLMGIVTSRDIVLETDESKNLKEVMTPKDRLITIKEGTTLEEAKQVIKKHKIEKLPIVNKSGIVVGLITSKDILKTLQHPLALKDKKGRLRVGAAIGVKGDYLERAEELIKAGVDVLVVDVAHGHADHTIDTVKKIKSKYQCDVIAGNVASEEGARDLIKAGADSIKVGVGPGAMCTTRIVTGAGVPQLTAIMSAVSATKKLRTKTPIIADGGVRFAGDIVKALAAGASSVMIGSLFAGCEESPGMTMIRNGRKYKMARGMASLGANVSKKSSEGELSDDFGLEYVAEGVEALVPFRGKVSEILNQLEGGIRSGFSYSGAKNIVSLWEKARFVQITSAGLKESYPHDVEVL